MLISAREAALRLAPTGLTRRRAREVLGAGFAGAPLETPTALLYDEERVAALSAWPRITDDDAARACPGGLFVARRRVDVAAPWDTFRDVMQDGWDCCLVSSALIRARISRDGHHALVATVCGFVAGAAEIAGVVRSGSTPARAGDHRHLLDLRQPGEWSAAFDRHRFPTGPGRPWVLR